MNKVLRSAILLATTVLSVSACSNDTPISSIGPRYRPDGVDENNIAFTSEDINQESFGGLGVEWGAYEDTDKIIEGGWEKALKHMDHLGAQRVRLMVSYDWFCQKFDDKGTKDHNDDTWVYNFNNKYARNMFDILDYCQTHDMEVAFGAWNVIADLSNGGANDVWGMMEEVTSDIRWAKITADTLDFLVKQKGYTCIKWFVNSNEPNYSGREGSSKNYNNTYAIWEQGVKNVRNALDKQGLTNIGIVGGDTTGLSGTTEYLTNIARNIATEVGDYGCHLYLSNIDVDRGQMFTQIDQIYRTIKALDPELGKSRQANVWEAGLLDGKTPDDRQTLITEASYAVRMTDYTIQCLAGGINGVVFWDFDDAMHFMYGDNNVVTPKEWGMFSSLAGASSGMQELRPWYHSSSLLCHLFRRGNKIYSPLQNLPLNQRGKYNMFRSLATISPDGKQGGFVAVNSSTKAVTKTFYMDDAVQGNQLYIYEFNEDSYRLNSEGYIEPNYVIEGSLNKKITLTIPSGTFFVVSNGRL